MVSRVNPMRVRCTTFAGRRVRSLPGPHYERRTDSSGGVTHVYRVGVTGRIVAERTVDEVSGDAVLHFLHRDERGSVILTTDEAGEPSSVAQFDVFGAVAGGPVETRVGYTGKLLDREFGLLVMGVRTYDPGLGMFTTPDLLRVSSLTATGQLCRSLRIRETGCSS